MEKDNLLDPEKIYIGLINSEKYQEWENQERYKINKVNNQYEDKLKSLRQDRIAAAILLLIPLDLAANYMFYRGFTNLFDNNSHIVARIIVFILTIIPKVLQCELAYKWISKSASEKANVENEQKVKLDELEKELEEKKKIKKKELFNL